LFSLEGEHIGKEPSIFPSKFWIVADKNRYTMPDFYHYVILIGNVKQFFQEFHRFFDQFMRFFWFADFDIVIQDFKKVLFGTHA